MTPENSTPDLPHLSNLVGKKGRGETTVSSYKTMIPLLRPPLSSSSSPPPPPPLILATMTMGGTKGRYRISNFVAADRTDGEGFQEKGKSNKKRKNF